MEHRHVFDQVLLSSASSTGSKCQDEHSICAPLEHALTNGSNACCLAVGTHSADQLFGAVAPMLINQLFMALGAESICLQLLSVDKRSLIEPLLDYRPLRNVDDAQTMTVHNAADADRILNTAVQLQDNANHTLLRATIPGMLIACDLVDIKGWRNESQSLDVLELKQNLALINKGDADKLSVREPLSSALENSMRHVCQLLICVSSSKERYTELLQAADFANEFGPIVGDASKQGDNSKSKGADAPSSRDSSMPDQRLRQVENELRETRNELDRIHTHYQRLMENGHFGMENSEVQRPSELYTYSDRRLPDQPSADSAPSPSSNVQGDIRELKKELKKVESEKNDALEQLQNAQAELTQYRNKVSELQLAQKHLEKKRSTELQEAQREKDELKRSLELEIDTYKRSMDEQLRKIHNGKVTQLSELQNQTLKGSSGTGTGRPESAIRSELQEEYASKIKEAQNTCAEEANKLQEQFEGLLQRKEHELSELQFEYQQYREAMEAKLREASEEGAYLAAYASRLGYLFEQIERRGYPTKERLSYQSLILPPRDKPGSIDVSKCKHALNATESIPQLKSFIEESKRLQDERKRSQEKDMHQERQPEVSEREQIRDEVEQQVAEELASHETVEYIRRLEEENAKSHSLLEQEMRKTSDLTVALQSMRRTGSASPAASERARAQTPTLFAETQGVDKYEFRLGSAASNRGASAFSGKALNASTSVQQARPRSTPPLQRKQERPATTMSDSSRRQRSGSAMSVSRSPSLPV